MSKADAGWEEVFDGMSDLVAVLDGEGMLLRGNLALTRALGPVPGESALHYSALLGKSADGWPDPIARSLADGRSHLEEARFQRLPGAYHVAVSPLMNKEGHLRGVVVSLRDISAWTQKLDRLSEAARLADISQLAGGVAHELSTPLASIALRAESLLRNAQDPALQALESFKPFPAYLKTIDEETFRCKEIIAALLQFSRLAKSQPREMDLNRLARESAERLRERVNLKKVTLSLSLEPELPSIRADDAQLRQALHALLLNALDATSAGGRIEIHTRSDPAGTVTLSVHDEGPGIPARDRSHIFTPFFSSKPVGRGAGLGLSICHGIVGSHGGEVRVENEEGRGTRVSLVLPLEPPPTPST